MIIKILSITLCIISALLLICIGICLGLFVLQEDCPDCNCPNLECPSFQTKECPTYKEKTHDQCIGDFLDEVQKLNQQKELIHEAING